MTTAAAPLGQRNREFFQVPNSVIENARHLTHAELLLMLVVLRNNHGVEVRVSDRTWSSWTGKEDRTKEYARKGLTKKTALRVDGRGNNARYTFERKEWETYARHEARTAPPARTEGRKVDPKPMAQISPRCREHGCAVLRSTEGDTGLTLEESSQLSQPVANSNSSPGEPALILIRSGCGAQKHVTPEPATPVAQPVARNESLGFVAMWALALEKLSSLFPLAGAFFLVRLLDAVRAVFPDVTDTELAAGIQYAYDHRRGVQQGEGLFLFTVPNAIAAIRKKKPDAKQLDAFALVRPGPPGWTVGLCLQLDGVAERIDKIARGLGAGYEKLMPGASDLVRDIGELIRRLDDHKHDFSLDPIADVERFNLEVLKIRERVCEVAAAVLTEEQFAAISREAEQFPAAVRDLVRLEQTFTILAIPLLDLAHA